jgi:4-hydroxy-tetrahydrodipicolinate reductase
MIRAIMNGANGHMGQVISQLCAEDQEIEIVAGIDPFDEGKNAYPVFATPQ